MSYPSLIKSAAPRSALGGGKTRAEGDRSFLAKSVILMLCFVLVATIMFSLAAGASDASVVSVIGAMFSGIDSTADALSLRDRIIIYDIRLPRVALGILVGSALAISGAVMQGLFRNPLADPGIVGVSARRQPRSGVGFIVLGAYGAVALDRRGSAFYALPLAAFFGGIVGDPCPLPGRYPARPDLHSHHAACRHRARRDGHGSVYRSS